jgi:hypothetical protein
MRRLIEDTPSLSVHRLHKAGALQGGAVTRWRWLDRIVEIAAHHDRAIIDGHEVSITWHPGTRGGSWASWVCRHCQRGAYLLYPDELLCWRCAGVDHATHNRWTPAPWRMRRLQRRVRVPRGQRYISWYDRLLACEALAVTALTATLEREKKAYERQQQRQCGRDSDP